MGVTRGGLPDPPKAGALIAAEIDRHMFENEKKTE